MGVWVSRVPQKLSSARLNLGQWTLYDDDDFREPTAIEDYPIYKAMREEPGFSRCA